MGVKIPDSLEPMTSGFPAAYGDNIWLDKNKGEGEPDYGNLQTMYEEGELGGGGSSDGEALGVASAAMAKATENADDISDLNDEVSSLSDEISTLREDISSLAGIKYPSVRNSLKRWIPKTWSGLTDFNGDYIWTDGEHVYYSNGTDQYVLDKSTSTWSTKTWNGLTDFESKDIWSDGDNIYYGYGSNHYVLNKETSTWSAKTWNGFSGSFEGRRVWTDGVNIYYSSSSDQYVLDKSTSTWSSKTWSGLPIYGDMIVTDGYNIMQYDDDASMYALDPQTSTWSMINNCNVAGYAESFWTDGEHLYFSNPTVGDQYVFGGFSYDSSHNLCATWGPVDWIGCNVDGQYIWTDGDNIYYSYGTDHYVLTKLKTSINAKPILS